MVSLRGGALSRKRVPIPQLCGLAMTEQVAIPAVAPAFSLPSDRNHHDASQRWCFPYARYRTQRWCRPSSASFCFLGSTRRPFSHNMGSPLPPSRPHPLFRTDTSVVFGKKRFFPLDSFGKGVFHQRDKKDFSLDEYTFKQHIGRSSPLSWFCC